MTTIRTLVWVSVTLSLAHIARSDNLPSDSKDLTNALEKFERTETLWLEVKIAEKRKEVVAILETHLLRETQAGNLEAAVALKEVIANLQGAGEENGKSNEANLKWLSSWEEAQSTFGAVEVTVPSTKNKRSPQSSKVRVSKGERFLIIPNPEDTWTGGGSKAGKFCDFQGYDPSQTRAAWMRLYFTIDNGEPIPVDPTLMTTADRDGFIKLFCEDGSVAGNIGEIRVVIIPRK